MAKTAAIILAAGEGKRMKSSKPKVLHEVLFKPMIDWVTDAAKDAGVDKICVVAGFEAGQLKAYLKGRYDIALQEQQLGTGHAVMQAGEFLKSCGAQDVAVLNGDAPFIDAGAIMGAYAVHCQGENAVTVITAEAKCPTGYGRIVRGGAGSVLRITEEKDADVQEKNITEINSGAYWFSVSALETALQKIEAKNAQGEYYLTDTVEIINEAGLKSGTYKLQDEMMTAGANDRRQLAALNGYARDTVIGRLYDGGVSVPDCSGVIIGPDVHIGRDTTILPGTIIKGATAIGEGCIIGPNSLLDNCIVAQRVVFNASQAYQSTIGAGVTVGPFSHLRPNTVLGDRVHVGDFVEIKNSNIGEDTKVPHLTYVGDADVGKKVNFGCGCVTVNYDGVSKNRTRVGDYAFISCNTNLVAPVQVGDNAYTGAGSTITKDIPANSLGVARARQENKEGWVLNHRPPRD